MRLMVALENRFYEGPSGNIFSNNIFDYGVWEKYLQVFDKVVIFARVGKSETVPPKKSASGPGVEFYRLPMFVGPKQYIINRGKLMKLAAKAPGKADAFILRVPGTMSTLLWKNLIQRSIPYGVEVVGNVKDSLNTCGVNSLAKPFLKAVLSGKQRLQCEKASAAAYVSQFYLQKHYPTKGWSTYYSSIDLKNQDILTEEQLSEKIGHLQEPFEGKRPFMICHAGTMAARYKGQDILIKAVSKCIKKGYNIELSLMGDGACRPFFESKAKECGIDDRVAFLGNLPPGEAVKKVYDRSDLLVLPSLTEGLPRTIIEAMARGLPCVSTRVGGIPELLPDKYLACPGCSDDLAERILHILSSRAVIAQIAKRNLAKSKEYHFEILNKRRIEFYHKVAGFCRNNH